MTPLLLLALLFAAWRIHARLRDIHAEVAAAHLRVGTLSCMVMSLLTGDGPDDDPGEAEPALGGNVIPLHGTMA